MAAEGNYIIESDIDNWGLAISATNNFATTDVNIADDKITVGLDIPTGSKIRFSSTSILLGGLSVNEIYYAIRVSAAIIKVASSPINAAAGTPIDLTSVGAGTHTINVGEGETLADRQAIIDGVEQFVEHVTKDYFYAKAFDMKFNGNNKDCLYLSIEQEILTVTNIYVNDIELASTEWDYDEDSVFGRIDAEEIDPMELEERINLFPRGHNNIRIVGTIGWLACPYLIKQACIILAKAENDDTLYETYNFKSERLGEYSYSRDGKNYTGIPGVDRNLDRFINRRPTLATY